MRIRRSPIRSLFGSKKPDAEPGEHAMDEPERTTAREPVLAAAPPPPTEPVPEPGAAIASLALHDPSPRVWNLWELERLAERTGDDGRAEERGLLLLHMRQFADASGDLPLEFDPLVRDAFGAGLAALVT